VDHPQRPLGPSETAYVSRTPEQPYDQDNDQDNSKYSPDTVRATAGVITAAIISEPATEKDDQQNNYEDQFHDELPFSEVVGFNRRCPFAMARSGHFIRIRAGPALDTLSSGEERCSEKMSTSHPRRNPRSLIECFAAHKEASGKGQEVRVKELEARN
jgi:hypothetical protein